MATKRPRAHPLAAQAPACNPWRPQPAATHGTLERQHPHPKDGLVTLETGHVYRYRPCVAGWAGEEETVSLSVSKLLKQFFDDFDGEAVARKFLSGWLADASAPNHKLAKYMQMTMKLSREQMVQEFVRFWGDIALDASTEGTRMHERIELYVNGQYEPTEEEQHGAPPHDLLCWIKMWQQFHPRLQLKPYRSEFSMVYVDPDTKRPLLAGQADLIAQDVHGGYHLFDWKRTNPKKGKLGEAVLHGAHSRQVKMATGVFKDCLKNDYTKYSAQLHTYAEILRQQYDIDVRSCWLVQIHPDLPHAHVVEAMDLASEARAALCELKARAAAPPPPPSSE
jgi:hypothetical protein